MADVFCDHGAYGLTTNRIGLDVPTWGVPQEGDGTTKDAATASSVGSIEFGSVPTSGTISICGASVSTTNVIGAADVGAAADALATNINATTATVSSAAAGGTPQLRNLVYARGPSNGAPAGTCQIMMRVGSDSLNYATNSNAQIAHSFDGTPTVVQFAGGSGGCWGWFMNPEPLGVDSSIIYFEYGIFIFAPYVGDYALPNVIWVRTGGGASKTIYAVLSAMKTANAPDNISRRYVFDTNTKWTSDSTEGQLVLSWRAYGAYKTQSWAVVRGTGARVTYYALRKGGFLIRHQTDNTNNAGGSLSASSIDGGAEFVNCAFESISENSDVKPRACLGIGGTAAVRCFNRFIDCDYTYIGEAKTCEVFVTFVNTAYDPYSFEWIGGNIHIPVYAAADPGPLMPTGTFNFDLFALRSVKFSGPVGGFDLLPTSPTFTFSTNIVVENCTGLNYPADTYLLPSPTIVYPGAFSARRIHFSWPDGSFRRETTQCSWEFNRNVSNWPTYSATLMDGVTPWSLRGVWINGTPRLSHETISPPISTFNGLASGTRTLAVEVFIPTAVTFDFHEFVCRMRWTDASGVPQVAHVELSASTAVWTHAGDYANHGPRKFELSGVSVKQYTPVIAEVVIMNSPSTGTNAFIYVDPVVKIQ